MSENKSEMVTIEVPVEWAKYRSNLILGYPQGDAIGYACKAALDARKSKYECWQEDVNASDATWGKLEHSNGGGWRPNTARLMAAAPQLLDALKNLHLLARKRGLYESQDNEDLIAIEAIRAALPPDVAAEVLGDDQ